jgi:hypothetical protein
MRILEYIMKLNIQEQNNCNNPAGLVLTQAHEQDVGLPLYEVDEYDDGGNNNNNNKVSVNWRSFLHRTRAVSGQPGEGLC